MALNTVASLMDGSCPATRSAAARSAGTDILAAVANHGTIMHQLKAAVSEVVQRRDSAFADHPACENDRVPQTPLWELADASTLFSGSRPSRTRFTWSIRKGASDS